MKTTLLLPCLIAIIIGCRSGSIDPIQLNGTQPIEIELKVGEEKTVVLSDSINNRTFVAIKFVEINDGRCSTDKCGVCYGGYANAKFQISSSSQTDSINLSRISCIDYDMPTDSPMFARQQVQGVGLGLVSLNDPNKRSLSKYVAKLRISRW